VTIDDFDSEHCSGKYCSGCQCVVGFRQMDRRVAMDPRGELLSVCVGGRQ
jgi:hypothetical protein